MFETTARRRRLRSSWLSSARGAGGKLPPAKQTSWNRLTDEKQAPSIALLKYAYRICSKAAYGAMDGYTGKSRGLPPFAGGVQTVSFRGMGRSFFGKSCPSGSARLGDTPSLPWWRQSPPCNLSANWIEKLRRAIDVTLFLVRFPCLNSLALQGATRPLQPLTSFSFS